MRSDRNRRTKKHAVGDAGRVEGLEARMLMAAVAWDGGAGDSFWHSPNNWSTNTVPTAADEVTIDIGTNPTILFNGATGTRSINSLIANEALTLSGGSLTITGGASFGAAFTLNGGTLATNGAAQATGAFELSGGTLTGAGTFTLSGPSEWSGGTMEGSGRTLVAAGSTLNLDGSTHNLGRLLENDGTMNWTAGAIAMDSATVQNDGTMTVNSPATLQMYGSGGVNRFANNGTLVKLGAGLTDILTSSTAVSFDSTGSTSVQAGTFRARSGGTSTGSFQIITGAILEVGGTTAFNSATISGTGLLSQSNAGTTTFTGTISGQVGIEVSNGTLEINSDVAIGGEFTLSSGVLRGSGRVTLNGVGEWTGGDMSGTGRTVVGATGVFTLAGSTHALNRVLETVGTTNWSAGGIAINAGSLQNSGPMTVGSGSTLQMYGAGGVNTFVNLPAGTITKTGAGLMDVLVSSTGVAFNNSGNVHVIEGEMRTRAGGTSTGVFTIDAVATLSLGGTQQFTGASIRGNGRLEQSNSGQTTFTGTIGTAKEHPTIAVSAGTLVINSNTTTAGPLDLEGGTLGGTGNITFIGASSWTGGTMAAGGRTTIGVGSSLSLDGSTHTLMRELVIAGTGNWTAGAIAMEDATLRNQGAMLIDSAFTLQMYGGGGSNAFINTGSITKDGTGMADVFVSSTGVAFNNGGMVTVNAGVFRTRAGGVSTGAFSIGAGAELQLGGVQSLSGPVTGAGTLVQDSSGTTTMTGQLVGVAVSVSAGTLLLNSSGTTSGRLDLSSGTLGGTGTWVLTSPDSVWSGGTMNGTGRTVIGPGGAMAFSGSTHTLERVFENQGSVMWTAGGIALGGGTILNAGNWTSDGTGTLQAYGASGVNAFVNTGTLTKLGANLTDFLTSSTAVTFTNQASGIIDVQQGTLSTRQGMTNNGTVHISAGAEVEVLFGAYVQTATGRLSTEIDGPVNTTFGRITAQTAAINGTFAVVFTNNYLQECGDAFMFLTTTQPNGVTGTFSTVSLPGPNNANSLRPVVLYSATSVRVQITSTADWGDGDGTLNSQDFFNFLADFFADDADFNQDGVTNSQDFFDFLSIFFSGC